MPNKYHCFVSLQVRGENLDFDSITAAVGIAPTKTVRRGERVRSDGWIYRIEKTDGTISGLLDILAEGLRGKKEILRDLALSHDVNIWCSHQTNLAMSGFELMPQNLSFLAEVGVRFVVSIFSEGEVED